MTLAGTVLVLSGPDDSTADAVVAELVERGAPIARLDLGDFPLRMTMRARLRQGRWQGQLSAADRTVELADVRAVYYRRPTRFTFPDGLPIAAALAEFLAKGAER